VVVRQLWLSVASSFVGVCFSAVAYYCFDRRVSASDLHVVTENIERRIADIGVMTAGMKK